MNDFKEGTKFSFGKIELAVIPNEIEIGRVTSTKMSCHSNYVRDPIESAMEHKQLAVDALDNLKFSVPKNYMESPYMIIRDSLEEMANLLKDMSFQKHNGAPVNNKKPVRPARGKNKKRGKNHAAV